MGYYTKIEGNIYVRPAFTTDQSDTFNEDSTDLYVDAEGDLIPLWEEPSKYYGIVTEVQRLIDANPDRKFTGYFECYGEEPGDIWRLVIKGRTATKVKARIVWDY